MRLPRSKESVVRRIRRYYRSRASMGVGRVGATLRLPAATGNWIRTGRGKGARHGVLHGFGLHDRPLLATYERHPRLAGRYLHRYDTRGRVVAT